MTPPYNSEHVIRPEFDELNALNASYMSNPRSLRANLILSTTDLYSINSYSDWSEKIVVMGTAPSSEI